MSQDFHIVRPEDPIDIMLEERNQSFPFHIPFTITLIPSEENIRETWQENLENHHSSQGWGELPSEASPLRRQGDLMLPSPDSSQRSLVEIFELPPALKLPSMEIMGHWLGNLQNSLAGHTVREYPQEQGNLTQELPIPDHAQGAKDVVLEVTQSHRRRYGAKTQEEEET